MANAKRDRKIGRELDLSTRRENRQDYCRFACYTDRIPKDSLMKRSSNLGRTDASDQRNSGVPCSSQDLITSMIRAQLLPEREPAG